MYLTVGEIAKRLGLNASTLRYYDKQGLLPFVERSESGIRLFKENDMGMLNMIECLKGTGMSIKDIKTFIDFYDTGDDEFKNRLDIIQHQKANVLAQMELLNYNLDMLDYKEFYYNKAKELGSLAAVESLPKDIAQACQQLWEQGQYREALSLLYRAALMYLTRHDQLPVHSSHTEGDILQLARQQLTGQRFAWLTAVTRSWQEIAYAHRTPTAQLVTPLFADWTKFAINASAEVKI